MEGLTGFQKISILVPAGKDVYKTVSFYEKLGFKLIHKEKEPPRMAVVKRDNAEFYLCQENYQQLGQPMNIRIMVDNIEEFYQECLTQKAIDPETKIQLQPWGTKEIEIIAPMSVHLVFYTLVDC
ncbi:MAG: hypothetical protein ACFBSE_03920 [Prochloraceae cyanobacterium]